VAEARSDAGLTQAQLAAAVGVERSALAKIETDSRGVSAMELLAIARELGRRMEWFVQSPPAPIASYRAMRDSGTQAIDRVLERVVRDVRFVATLDPSLFGAVPPTHPVPESMRDAEQLASDARDELGLARDEPVYGLADRLVGVGLMAFSLPLGEGADAGTVLLELGGVAVVNGDLLPGRRRLALAHEFGHYLVADQYTTDWRVAVDQSAGLEARLDRFARGLLLPAEDLVGRWADWVSRTDETLRDAAVRAGSHYRVDMATLADRLRELGVVEAQQAQAIRQVHTKKADIVEMNLHVVHELEPKWLPRPFERSVLSLYRREVITADRALDLVQGTYDLESLPDLPPGRDHEIWDVTAWA
jgi:Zn-dependent peptidase ImmA (M78 family)/DNA-binding XRE family transcriptional regulator